MTYTEFKEKVGKACGSYNDDYMRIEWTIGGVGGGNCWDDESVHYSVEAELEPEFNYLETIFTDVLKNPSLQLYLKAKKLVIYDTYSVNEYYGNYTNYATRTLDLKTLYELLVEENAF